MASGSELARKAERAGHHARAPFVWRLGLGEFVRETVEQVRAEHLTVHAGNIAFRAVFAVFPSILALLWLLTALNARDFVATLLDLISTVLPEAATGPLRQQVESAPRDQASGSFTLGAAISLAVAVWAFSEMFRAIMTGLNAMYAVQERRPFWRRALVSVLLSLAVVGLLAGALVLLVFGPRIGERVADETGLGAGFGVAWEIGTWPLLALAVWVAFALTYYFGPDVEQRVRWVSTGTVIAVALWLLFSVLFSLYVNTIAPLSETYGALAGIAVFMVYMYVSSFILLLGAEMNQVIELHHPTGKNEGERNPAKS